MKIAFEIFIIFIKYFINIQYLVVLRHYKS